MDENVVSATRRSWHAVAERLLAGPQHRAAACFVEGRAAART
jgi:hypothetical protein